jgi:deoxyribodipyrimidine photo-lyase
MTCSLMWFRRDLRRADNPALAEAVAAADQAIPVFVFDPALRDPAARPRRAYLLASLAPYATGSAGWRRCAAIRQTRSPG